MDSNHRIFFALALALTTPLLNAESNQAAYDFCRSQTAQGKGDCYIHPCPCHPNEFSLQTFDLNEDGQSLCACRSQRENILNNRQSAVSACDDYQLTHHLPCFVSRSDCPAGFESLGTYDSGPGTRFTACRDQRHTRISSDTARMDATRSLQQDEQIRQYEKLIAALEKQRQGEFKPLPSTSLDQLENFFPGHALDRIRLTRTNALAKGCFTDCEKVYCAGTEPIDQWTRPTSPLITRQLLHQVVHSEDCGQQGGREQFVSRWFRHLPDFVLEQLLAGVAIDAGRIHFAMYMERHAEGRADSICRRLPGCLGE
jgi:hypothetical protein